MIVVVCPTGTDFSQKQYLRPVPASGFKKRFPKADHHRIQMERYPERSLEIPWNAVNL